MTFEETLVQAFIKMRKQLKEELREELRAEMNLSPDRTLTFKEALEYLHMSEYTLRRLCREKKIPHRTYGAEGSKNPRYLFSTTRLAQWIRDMEDANYRQEATP